MPGTAADIMTRNPITYHVPSTVGEVIKILIKNNITGLPLVDQSGKYAGVISRRDIFENPDENQTAMVMRRAKAVTPDTTVEEAAREMIKQFRRHLAVVDDSGNVVGIHSESGCPGACQQGVRYPALLAAGYSFLFPSFLRRLPLYLWNLQPPDF